MGNILQCSTDWLVFLDETGCDNRDQIRRYGYSLIGEPPVHHRFLNRGTRISTICALSQEGLAYYKLLTATTNGDKFYDFIRGSIMRITLHNNLRVRHVYFVHTAAVQQL